MLARVYTATMIGLEALKVEVEVDGNRGTPSFILIGLPSKAIDEAKERISAALQNCGIRIRGKRTIVNLAPADIPKTGSSFDLAIAIGLLKMYGEVTLPTDDTMFFGELALDGRVKQTRGVLPFVLAAKNSGFANVVIPAANQDEVSIISGVTIYPIQHLQEYLDFAQRRGQLEPLKPQPFTKIDQLPSPVDWADIRGQEQAKRALVIAAAGGHNLLLDGTPGSGKSLMAKALSSILPPLTETEAIEVTNIYSICGLTSGSLVRHRPFRSPHHTTSQVGLIGGGANLKPGEISLAHRGVLFLDELLEFPRDTLEALRQPLEDGCISISRASGVMTYPASFSLIAATNPCPCGYKFSQQKQKECKCAPSLVEKYQKKLSGPMLDRIDLRVFVREVELGKLTRQPTINPAESSAQVREQVIAARQRQAQRYQHTPYQTNSELMAKYVHQFCEVAPAAKILLSKAAYSFGLSARRYFKTIQVAQTIADLENAPKIEESHVAEALQYR